MYLSAVLLVLTGIVTSEAAGQPKVEVTPPPPGIKTTMVSVIVCRDRRNARRHYMMFLESKSADEMFRAEATVKQDTSCFIEFREVNTELLRGCTRKADVAACAAIKVTKGESGKKARHFMSIIPQGR